MRLQNGRNLTVILDASAVLAVLRREPGWVAVEEVVTDAVLSAINAGEVLQRQLRMGLSRIDAEEILQQLELSIMPVDLPLALDAAELRHSLSKFGLSQADSVCLALARRLGAPAMTADKAWERAGEEIGVEVRLIR